MDAAVGMMLLSCAAETIYTGLGGGGFATCYDQATGEVTCVDFFVSVPGLDGKHRSSGTAIEVMFAGQQMPYEIGPATVAVPGVPAGALHLWRRWGRLPWADVVGPGFTRRRRVRRSPMRTPLCYRGSPPRCAWVKGSRSTSARTVRYLQGGDPLIHPDHIRAYELLLDEPDAFYRGDYAEALVASVDDGGALSQEDLDAYGVVESMPRTAPARRLHRVRAGERSGRRLADPDHAGGHLAGDPATDPASALGLIEALRAPAKRAETTNSWRSTITVTAARSPPVLASARGFGYPDFGVHLNSMIGEGELVREHLRPGVRMGSMMSPMVALDDHGLALIAGAAGGSRIRPALVQCMLRILRGMAPQDAIDAPRLNALRDLVRLEPGFAPEVLDAIESAGDRVRGPRTRDPYFGGVSAISSLGGGADPRRSGYVVMALIRRPGGAPIS